MAITQSGILSGETLLARYMTFNVIDIEAAKDCLTKLTDIVDGQSLIAGFGVSLVTAFAVEIKGLHNMPVNTSSAIDIPSTPSALWLWLRGNDRGELFHRSRNLEELLVDAFELSDVVDSFQYSDCRDLSGYVDGTENPEGDDAFNAAIVTDQGKGLDGSSFVAVQQWIHDFDMLDSMTTDEKDNSFGRHISNNEEFDAPGYAHVKRTAQESFEPEAFIVRRSMPWAEGMNAGLMFVAFGKSFAAFEALLSRMLGHDDKIQDAIFNFTKPISGAYFWCPPMKDGKLDLSGLGL